MARRERNRRSRKKVCQFCVDKVEHIDYKDTNRLKKYMTERGNAASLVTVQSISAH